MADLSSLACPRNFAATYEKPQDKACILYKLRECEDFPGGMGVAIIMMSTGGFVGWVQEQDSHIIYDKLEARHNVLGIIQQVLI